MKKTSTPWGSVVGGIAVLAVIILVVIITQSGSGNSYNLKNPTLGPDNAKVTIDIYSDFECPACQQQNLTILPKLEKKYKDRVKFVFHQFPLEQHKAGKVAAYASACVDDQGKFWQYHDILVGKYDEWTQDTNQLEQYVKDLNLDVTRFNSCRESKSVKTFINNSYNEGIDRKVESTPTLFIGGEKIVGVEPLNNYYKIIDKFLNAK